MQEKKYDLSTPVRYFKGVGPKKCEYLAMMGISNVGDLLYYLPKRYEDRSNFTPIKDLKVGEYQTVQGEIITVSARRTKRGLAMVEIAISDQTGFIHAVWFNQPYLNDYFKRGRRVVIYGKVERFDKLQIVQPEYEVLEGGEVDSIHIGRIVPIYPLTANVTQKYLRTLVFLAISKYHKAVAERMPTYLIARQHLVDSRFAISNIHFPSSFDNLDKAYRRVVFEEFFMLQLALAMKKKGQNAAGIGQAFNIGGALTSSLKKALPFELTDAQKKAIGEIERDMVSTRPMNRLLEGDVGSGKTVIAAYALALAVENGFQGVMMAPTEVLARQSFITLSELFMPLGVNVVMLISGIEMSAKERIYFDIKEGKAAVVVGTHAVIQESVEFKNLGLAVIDEQHKFGVTQRAILGRKGHNVHTLVMTATPIPRTLAMTVYGDLDISIIKELPKGRKPVATYLVEKEKRQDVYNFIREELDKGGQAYVVCPLIDEGQGSRLRQGYGWQARVKGPGAEKLFNDLKSGPFANYEVGLLHGRMASKEKERIMKEFKAGKIDILVSTVVIEVGLDIPNASVMLIEDAERFGLAQLHQLRGRIGRGKRESYCILLADPKTDEARTRLETIEETLDGFEIAEADLNIRGPGEFLGTRQHGLPEIRFGNIVKDFAIMELARKEAFSLIARDPDMDEEHHRLLKEGLVSRFKEKADLAKVG